MVKVLLFSREEVTDVETLGQAIILRNLAYGFLEEGSNTEDQLLDEKIEDLERINRLGAYEENVDEAKKIIKNKLSGITSTKISKLNTIKKFKGKLIDFTKMDFTIDDLKNPNTFATILGRGEETEEYEKLTETGEDSDIIIENMEEILEEESEEYPFKTLIDTMKKNMEVTTGRGNLIISFGDDEKKSFTEQVLADYKPSSLFRVDYPRTKKDDIFKEDVVLMEKITGKEGSSLSPTAWRRAEDPKGKTFLKIYGLDEKLRDDINGFNLMDLYDVEFDASQQKTSVKVGEERVSVVSEGRVILSLKNIDKNTAFKLLMHCLFPRDAGNRRRRIIGALSDFKILADVKVILPDEIILDPYKNELRKEEFSFDEITARVEVIRTGELRFTRVPVRTEGRGGFAREKRVSRNIPEYFTVSTEVSEGASLAEIAEQEEGSKTGAFTEQVNASRDEATNFLQNLLANTYELEEALED
tara:strand:- start:390 stop:1808 length:1419 start_codon:yes stop_codon:yes gene_type:complete